jgi:hypothetical protein
MYLQVRLLVVTELGPEMVVLWIMYQQGSLTDIPTPKIVYSPLNSEHYL